jgi:hypothetical protein
LHAGRRPAGWRERAIVLSEGRAGSLECYDSGRYLTVTGQRLADSPADVGPVDPARLAAWHAAHTLPRPPTGPSRNAASAARSALREGALPWQPSPAKRGRTSMGLEGQDAF